MKDSVLFRKLGKFWKRTSNDTKADKRLINNLKEAEENADISEKSQGS
ncbi:hypothetical protein NARC_30103 [Candidatus Nitrosocosmicus arcticus]|uniref:Uncharacterized protein n=1 Tax=Candidatus Nitrosocosmicus arcticus TaxID=2035267 RepID=A0A557SXQ3_9ARCH|nr:hypothetical protein NARC_30103 [Candidatus Nitrosocosmicus arcticus]